LPLAGGKYIESITCAEKIRKIMRRVAFSPEGAPEEWACGEAWIRELTWREAGDLPALGKHTHSSAAIIIGAVLGDGHVRAGPTGRPSHVSLAVQVHDVTPPSVATTVCSLCGKKGRRTTWLHHYPATLLLPLSKARHPVHAVACLLTLRH
jgi:hypothetical protein